MLRRSFDTLRRWRRPRGPSSVRTAVLLGGALALAVACGGPPEVDLPGPDSPTAPLTHKAFVDQANAICRAATRAAVERTDDVGGNALGTDAGNRQKLLDAIEPISSQALTKLRNLTPPPEDAATARAAFDAMQAAADAARSDPTAPLDPVGLNRPEFFEFGLTGCFTKR